MKFGFTELSDLSITQMEELSSTFLSPEPQNSDSDLVKHEAFGHRCDATEMTIPESFDWRNHGAVTSVKHQRRCGSCWAMAAVASVESAILIHRRNHNASTLDLAEQQLLDCSPRHCNGGTARVAFNYIRAFGIGEENAMPYRGRRSITGCPLRRLNLSTHRIDDFCVTNLWSRVSDKRIQQALLKFGPLFIAMHANFALRNYNGNGIIDQLLYCPAWIPNHAVLLVGYTKDAWIIRNSWGQSWGDKGYLYIRKGDRNICAINSQIAWPLLK